MRWLETHKMEILLLCTQAVPIYDPTILSKIHQTYRIGYIKVSHPQFVFWTSLSCSLWCLRIEDFVVVFGTAVIMFKLDFTQTIKFLFVFSSFICHQECL